MQREIGIDDVIAAARTLRRPMPAPLVIVRRATRCARCGLRIAAHDEARWLSEVVIIHDACVTAFAGYSAGGR
jgi:hypothetical protein